MSRLDTLHDEMARIRSAVETIESTAKAESRDLSDSEQADVDALLTRADTIRPELDKEVARQRSLTAASDVLARVSTPTAPTVDIATMTAGEYFSLFARSQAGDEKAGLLVRAVADQLTTDVPGLLPAPIVGNVIKFADDSRPVFNSFTARPMPAAGKTFERPRVTQRVNVGEQLTEKAELTSRKMTVTSDTVTKRTFGGTLDISQQAIDWSEPALLDLAIADFAGVYANIVEGEACDYLASITSASVAWTATNIGTIVGSVLDGVEAVYTSAKRMPDTLWLSLDEMLDLAGTTNTNNDVTAMQLIRTALAEAGVPLRVVTGPQLAANTRIVGNSGLIESYEQTKGLLQAINVPLFGWDIAYAGYVAFNGYSQAVCKLV